MIDISKYPNMQPSARDGGKSFKRLLSKTDEVVVWILPSGFLLDRYKEGLGCVAAYRFDSLEDALHVANNLDGTEEDWTVLDEFKECDK